jgi:hypothetical protein
MRTRDADDGHVRPAPVQAGFTDGEQRGNQGDWQRGGSADDDPPRDGIEPTTGRRVGGAYGIRSRNNPGTQP